MITYTKEQKISYFSKRVNDNKLTSGQKSYAQKKLNELTGNRKNVLRNERDSLKSNVKIKTLHGYIDKIYDRKINEVDNKTSSRKNNFERNAKKLANAKGLSKPTKKEYNYLEDKYRLKSNFRSEYNAAIYHSKSKKEKKEKLIELYKNLTSQMELPRLSSTAKDLRSRVAVKLNEIDNNWLKYN